MTTFLSAADFIRELKQSCNQFPKQPSASPPHDAFKQAHETKEWGTGSVEKVLAKRKVKKDGVIFRHLLGKPEEGRNENDSSKPAGYVFLAPYDYAAELVKEDKQLFEHNPGLGMMRLTLDIDVSDQFRDRAHLNDSIKMLLPEVIDWFRHHYKLQGQQQSCFVFDSSYFKSQVKDKTLEREGRVPQSGSKLSLHVHFPFVVLRNLKAFKELLKKIKQDDHLKSNPLFQYIDESIYGPNRCFRVENQSKYRVWHEVKGQTLDPLQGTWNNEVLEGDWTNPPFPFKSSMFVYEREKDDKRLIFVDEEPIEAGNPSKAIRARAQLGTASIKEHFPESDPGSCLGEITVAVKNIIDPLDKAFMEGFFLQHRNPKPGMTQYGQLCARYMLVKPNVNFRCHCGRIHESDNSSLMITKDQVRGSVGILSVFCFRTSQVKEIKFRQKVGIKDKKRSLEELEDDTHELVKFNTEYLTQGEGFTLDRSYDKIYVSCRCGGGKTHAFGQLLKDTTRKNMLLVTVRCTECDDFMGRMKKYAEGTPFTVIDYREAPTYRIDKCYDDKGKLKQKTFYNLSRDPTKRYMFICQIDSVTKIDSNDLGLFDTVILDEAVSVLDRSMRLKKSVSIFSQLMQLRHAQVIMMDALIDADTIEAYEIIFESRSAKNLLLLNEYSRDIKFRRVVNDDTSKIKKLFHTIIELMKQGRKRFTISFDHLDNMRDCEQFLKQFNVMVVTVCGDESQESKRGKLRDINKTLEDCVFFLYTQSITVGVDITLPDFQTHLALFWGGSSSYIDQLQMLYRPRCMTEVYLICDAEPLKIKIDNSVNEKLYEWPLLHSVWGRVRKILKRIHQQTIFDYVTFENWVCPIHKLEWLPESCGRDYKMWALETIQTQPKFFMGLVHDYLKVNQDRTWQFPSPPMSTQEVPMIARISEFSASVDFVGRVTTQTLGELHKFNKKRHDFDNGFRIWCYNRAHGSPNLTVPTIAEHSGETYQREIYVKNARAFEHVFEKYLSKIVKAPQVTGFDYQYALKLEDVGIIANNSTIALREMFVSLKPLIDDKLLCVSKDSRSIGHNKKRYRGITIQCQQFEQMMWPQGLNTVVRDYEEPYGTGDDDDCLAGAYDE